MSVQQGTKAPFFLSLFFFALGAKAKTNGTARLAGQSSVSWKYRYHQISLGTVCQRLL